MATKCRICKSLADYAWQPWGPAVEALRAGFVLLGSHYRGFPVVPVCESCKRDIEHDDAVRFAVKGRSYVLDGDDLRQEA
jgi:hypothetical protein